MNTKVQPPAQFVLYLSLFLLAAMAQTLPAAEAKTEATSTSLPSSAIRVPLVRQSTPYTCGVAALQSVLAYFGDEHREGDLAKACKSNNQIGTAYTRIANYAQSRGFTVEISKDMKLADLKSALERKLPVICLIQAWPEREVNFAQDWQDGHYVVAIGYDAERIYFMDPSTLGHYAFIPTAEFLTRWHDTDGKEKLFNFGMIISRQSDTYNADEVKPLN